MPCLTVGGFLQACNVKKPPGIVNNGEESPARRYKMNELFSQKKLSGAQKFISWLCRELWLRRYIIVYFRASTRAWYLRYLLWYGCGTQPEG
ncbi:hypothetical protein C4E24_04510 [ANME-1 cluster archaeon AG-394-G21]|nr:hypothetical protein [ANME-1 cluster archaeon AG-394-G21]